MNTSSNRRIPWTLYAGCLLVAKISLACAPDKSVQMEQLSKSRSGQIVEDDYIRLVEGQSIGIGVEAFRNDILKEGWSIEASSSNRSVLSVGVMKEEKNFVISGVSAGDAELRFLLRGRYQVLIDVEVTPRSLWHPPTRDDNLEPFAPRNDAQGGAGSGDN